MLLSAVSSAASALQIRWLVVGATGRVLLLEEVYGLPRGRATEDVDFGVMVESWYPLAELNPMATWSVGLQTATL